MQKEVMLPKDTVNNLQNYETLYLINSTISGGKFK